MTCGQWIGLAISLFGLSIPGLIYRVDLVLWATGRATISEGVWYDLRLWRMNAGPFPLRALWLPFGIALAGLVSGLGLAIHFFF